MIKKYYFELHQKYPLLEKILRKTIEKDDGHLFELLTKKKIVFELYPNIIDIFPKVSVRLTLSYNIGMELNYHQNVKQLYKEKGRRFDAVVWQISSTTDNSLVNLHDGALTACL